MNFQALYTFEQTCQLLHLNDAQLQDQLDNKKLRATHFPFGVRITGKELKTYIRKHQHRNTPKLGKRPAIFASALLMLTTTAFAMSSFPDWQHIPAPAIKSIFSNYDSTTEFFTQWLRIDAPIQFNRFNDQANIVGSDSTHSVMSLQFNNEVNGGESFPWPLFVNLDTDHGTGDGVSGLFRLHNRDSGWGASTHVDGFAYGMGPTIGSNIEMLNLNEANQSVFGLNIQNKAYEAQSAINIQTAPIPSNDPNWRPGMEGSWKTGISFQSGSNIDSQFTTGIDFGPNTYGDRGIWLQGDFEAGIDMGANNLRMNAGSKIELESTGQVAMRYNPETYRIEFLYGEEVIGFLNTSDRDINLANGSTQ
ncbi:MAG: hypothetical protein COB04_13480 [Gammaproteobacteria bacterium]|nr:MAG: hypothetical protein COB04_13480 [Gammaproteobacteria bacterium]